MRKTKIVCTLGPASKSEAVIGELLKNGLNVARLNFSHGTHDEQKEIIEVFRRVRDRMHLPAAVMLDTKGPEIRIRDVENNGVTLQSGDPFVLTTRPVLGNTEHATVSYTDLPRQLSEGNRILVDDGKLSLLVRSCTEEEIHCVVETGGLLRSKKSINVPYIHLDMPYISPADEADLLLGIELDVDFVAASFVRSKEDVIGLRKFLDFHGGHSIKIISKIENTEGVKKFEEILQYSDGIMVARGDMGVEVAFEKIPGIQKKFIRKCYQSGKMVITATQMLESMIHDPMPTRAEITDVANAVFDGTSAVMLSGETAMGDHPAQVVKVMAKIAEQAEEDARELNLTGGFHHDIDFSDMTNAVCDAACTMARDVNAKAIIAVTKSGQAARRVSKFRPLMPIIASTPEKKTFHQLALSWGVMPVLALNQPDTDHLFRHAIDCAKQIDLVEAGDTVVITAGVPISVSGNTNLLKVQTV